MSTKLQQLLGAIQSHTQTDVGTWRPTGKMPAADLARHELFEVLRRGYWPVSLLRQQNHWLCEGETLDDSGSTGFVEDDNDIAGYEFRCWIADHIAIQLAVLQGNVLEIDSHHTVLRFDCYDLDTGDEIARQQFEITQFAQIDEILNCNWNPFIEQIWPTVDDCINKKIDKMINFPSNSVIDDSDEHLVHVENRDRVLHLELTKLFWSRLNYKLQEDLLNWNFYDWNVLDEIENWMKT